MRTSIRSSEFDRDPMGNQSLLPLISEENPMRGDNTPLQRRINSSSICLLASFLDGASQLAAYSSKPMHHVLSIKKTGLGFCLFCLFVYLFVSFFGSDPIE